MRTIAMSHLLPAITASSGCGLADYALSASLLRGAGLGVIAGAVYSATKDVMSKKFEVENSIVAHSVAIITSAVVTFGAVFLAAAAGAMEMPSLTAFGTIFITAIAVDAIFRMVVAHFSKNETKKQDMPNPVEVPAQPANPPVPVADPAAVRVPVNPPPQPSIYPPPVSAAPIPAVPPAAMPQAAVQASVVPAVAAPSTPQGPQVVSPTQAAAGPSAAHVAVGKTPPPSPSAATAAPSTTPATPAQPLQNVPPAAASAAAGKTPPLIPAAAKAAPSAAPSTPASPAPATTPPAASPADGKAPSKQMSPQQKEAEIKKAKFPLIEAIRRSWFDVAESLITKENINCEDDGKNTPLSYAVRRGNKALVDKLIAMGAKTDCVNKAKYTLLHQAAYSGNLDLVVQFQTKANLETAAKYGYTPLAVALSQGHDHIVDHLVVNGANLNFELKNKNTSLHVAVHGNSRKYCTLLMTDENLKKKNKWGATPLAEAVMHNRIEIAEEMVAKKADVKTTMKDSNKNLLHLAAEKCSNESNLQRVHKFCKPEAMEAKDADGNTPLLLALKKDQPANAAWLLDNGAKADCKNNAKETPSSVAKTKNYAQFLRLLAIKGAKEIWSTWWQ